MKVRRSKIASDILTLVKKFFEGPDFHMRPKKIKNYVPWALGAGGPAYYDTPVPTDCTLQLGDPDCPVSSFLYWKLVLITCWTPDGFLCSQFILLVVKQYLAFAERSVLHPSLGPRSPPKGLYAIILTAVHQNHVSILCLTTLTGRACSESPYYRRVHCTR